MEMLGLSFVARTKQLNERTNKHKLKVHSIISLSMAILNAVSIAAAVPVLEIIVLRAAVLVFPWNLPMHGDTIGNRYA